LKNAKSEHLIGWSFPNLTNEIGLFRNQRFWLGANIVNLKSDLLHTSVWKHSTKVGYARILLYCNMLGHVYRTVKLEQNRSQFEEYNISLEPLEKRAIIIKLGFSEVQKQLTPDEYIRRLPSTFRWCPTERSLLSGIDKRISNKSAKPKNVC
jgi:hypothetical protein